jgi:hypothetical protein
MVRTRSSQFLLISFLGFTFLFLPFVITQ